MKPISSSVTGLILLMATVATGAPLPLPNQTPAFDSVREAAAPPDTLQGKVWPPALTNWGIPMREAEAAQGPGKPPNVAVTVASGTDINWGKNKRDDPDGGPYKPLDGAEHDWGKKTRRVPEEGVAYNIEVDTAGEKEWGRKRSADDLDGGSSVPEWDNLDGGVSVPEWGRRKRNVVYSTDRHTAGKVDDVNVGTDGQNEWGRRKRNVEYSTNKATAGKVDENPRNVHYYGLRKSSV